MDNKQQANRALNKGNMTLLCCTLLLLLSYLFCLSLTKQNSALKAMNSRKNQVLCLVVHRATLFNHLKVMERLNQSIKISYYASLIPKSKEAALAAIELFKRMQLANVAYTTKKIMSIKNCQFIDRMKFVYDLPYLHHGLLSRNGQQQATLRENPWELQIHAKGLPNIHASYQLISDFSIRVAVKERDGG